MADAEAHTWPSLTLAPGLYLVPSPIGNLHDITLRALGTLAAADRIACEDTRHSGKLLQAFGIQKPLVSLHQHNENQRADGLIERAKAAGESLAVLTDAGMPGISDPGYRVVQAALEQAFPIDVLPGATAFVPALIGSGLPLDRFVFEGFLPPKKGRQTRIQALATEARTLVLYESPHRLVKTLGELSAAWGGDRPTAVARELTKLHQEYQRGTLAALHALFTERAAAPGGIKGEIVLLVGGAKEAGQNRGADA